ncbi:MAG: ABC transporter ATP-binding protein [Deltaproteobacteria bacterium]|nr:ABC transporter ATP-binding protein [Deltaproteobacteria bacterium]
MIRMEGVKKVYRNGLLAMEALSDITLRVKPGEFVSIMGPSGSGKTTFLNVAGLLDSFEGGQYVLDGIDVKALGDRALARLRNERIGFVFQSFNLIPDLDVFENIELPLRYRRLDSAERTRRVERALEQVELTARRHHLPGQLSGGQQQRVAIARALAPEPRLILADEPTGNLDSMMARQIMDLLDRVNASGATIVMVTHSAELAARAHRKLHVLDGRVIDPWVRRHHPVAPAS